MIFSIWNINFKTKKPKHKYTERVQNIARLVAQFDNKYKRAGGIFFFSEAWNVKKNTKWGIFGTKHHYPRKLKWKSNGVLKEGFTAECFFETWLEYLDPAIKPYQTNSLVTYQFADVAILANPDLFAIQGAPIGGYHGESGWNKLQYAYAGIPLQVKKTDFLLKVYATHLPTSETGAKRQRRSCKDIVEAVTNNWYYGDLPPIVGGDFNFYADEEDRGGDLMATFFTEVHLFCGKRDIEHIWVGKRLGFTGSPGLFLIKRNTFQPHVEFADGANTYSDHNAPYIQLEMMPFEQYKKVDSLLLLLSSTS